MGEHEHDHTHDHPIDPVGGQALLEGVMMRGKRSWGMAVRRPSGNITCHSFGLEPLAQRYRALRLPVVRGVATLGESLSLGMRALSMSANLAMVDDTLEAEEAEGEQGFGWRELAVTFLVAILLAVGLFIVIPLAVVKYFEDTFSNPVVFNLVEGLIRIAIFVLYIVVVSRLPDLQRVFQYHGAEHKAIHALESGEELDPGHVQRFTTLHPRCGTAFLLVVMVVSILLFSLVGKPSLLWLVVSRLIGIPLVVGVSYEVIRYAGRHKDGPISRVVLWPGLALQRLTTRQPSLEQVEVAIVALKEVLRVEAGGEPVPLGMRVESPEALLVQDLPAESLP
jgi:uncharacterized protein YqhQ